MYHVLVVYLRKERFVHVTMVGYSAVVFGLMTLSALSKPHPALLSSVLYAAVANEPVMP